MSSKIIVINICTAHSFFLYVTSNARTRRCRDGWSDVRVALYPLTEPLRTYARAYVCMRVYVRCVYECVCIYECVSDGYTSALCIYARRMCMLHAFDASYYTVTDFPADHHHRGGCYTVRTESQSVWHWSQRTRCTDSYTRGGQGGKEVVGSRDEEEEGRR